MKPFIFFSAIILSGIFFSCSQPGSAPIAGNDSTMTGSAKDESKRMTDLNEKVYRALETGNFSGLDTVMADDIVDHSSATGKEIKGKDSAIAMLKSSSANMKGLKMETKSSAYDPENQMVFSLVKMTGTTVAAMDNMPANTSFDMTSVDVIKIKNGKVTDHWAFNDPADMMKMMAKPTGQKK